jgi:hypothetical protein
MRNTWLVFFSKNKLIFLKHFFLLYFNFFFSFNFFFFFLKNEKIKRRYFFLNTAFFINPLLLASANNSLFHFKTFLKFPDADKNAKSIIKIKTPLN